MNVKPLTRDETSVLAARAGIPATQERLDALVAASVYANDILSNVWARDCAPSSEPAHMFAPHAAAEEADR